MSDPGDPRPAGPDAYREGTEAARARVQALERELAGARHQLSAMEARSAPVTAPLVPGLALLFYGWLVDLILGVTSWLTYHISGGLDTRRLLSGAFSLLFSGVAVLVLVALLRLRRTAGELGRGNVLTWALWGWVAGLGLRLLGLAELAGIRLPLEWATQALVWRGVALLSYVPLLFLYYRLGRQLGRRDLTGLALATGIVFVLVQAAFAATILPYFVASGLGAIYSVLGWVNVAGDVLWTVLAGMSAAAARTPRS